MEYQVQVSRVLADPRIQWSVVSVLIHVVILDGDRIEKLKGDRPSLA